MLLRLLCPLVWICLRVFFRRLDVRGKEGVPLNRPLIFVANHPNVMLDSLILALTAPGPTPSFLGKSTLFRNWLYALLLRQLGVIPVSRAMDGVAAGGNLNMVKQACDALQQGRSLALFPEGLSHPDLKVRRLKPGGARLALRAEDASDGRADVALVPVGLTYSDPGLFRSRVAVHFGEPIEVRPHLETYRPQSPRRGEPADRVAARATERSHLAHRQSRPGNRGARPRRGLYGKHRRRAAGFGDPFG